MLLETVESLRKSSSHAEAAPYKKKPLQQRRLFMCASPLHVDEVYLGGSLGCDASPGSQLGPGTRGVLWDKATTLGLEPWG